MFENKTEFIEFLNKEENKNTTFIILVTATWCGPCKKAKPVIYNNLKQTPTLKYIEIDYDKYSGFVGGYLKVKTIPTLFAFINGEKQYICYSSNADNINDFFKNVTEHQ